MEVLLLLLIFIILLILITLMNTLLTDSWVRRRNAYNDADRERLMNDAGIIRNKL
jgi:hypothetical protein